MNKIKLHKKTKFDFLYLLVTNQSKEKHFGSVGDVYSIGYSAKYCIKNELSFDWFVTSK